MSKFDEDDYNFPGYSPIRRPPSSVSYGTVYAAPRPLLSPGVSVGDPLEQPHSLSPGPSSVYSQDRLLYGGLTAPLLANSEPLAPTQQQVAPQLVDITATTRRNPFARDVPPLIRPAAQKFDPFAQTTQAPVAFDPRMSLPMPIGTKPAPSNAYESNHRPAWASMPELHQEPLNSSAFIKNVEDVIQYSALPQDDNSATRATAAKRLWLQAQAGPVKDGSVRPGGSSAPVGDYKGESAAEPLPGQASSPVAPTEVEVSINAKSAETTTNHVTTATMPSAPSQDQSKPEDELPLKSTSPNQPVNSAVPQTLSAEEVKSALEAVNASITNAPPPAAARLASSGRNPFHTATGTTPSCPSPSVVQTTAQQVTGPAAEDNPSISVISKEQTRAGAPQPFVDIMYANGGNPAENWNDDRVAHNVRSWLEKPTPSSWRLRLLIGTRARSNTSVARLPFDKATFKLLKEAWSLPDQMLDAAQDHHEFMTYSITDDPKRKSRQIGLIFRMMTFDQDGSCLALSYDEATHSTYALLLGLIDRPGQAVNVELAEQIYGSTTPPWHPLLLPLILLRQRSERIGARVTSAVAAGFELDLSRGFDKPSWQHQPTSEKRAAVPPTVDLKINDFESAILRLGVLSADVGFIHLVLDLFLSSLAKIMDLLQTTTTIDQALPTRVFDPKDAANEDISAGMREFNSSLFRNLSYMESINKSRLLRVDQVKEKLQIQLQAIQTLIAQRDNRINMNDSSSVNTISIVILAFLPGTFIVSFFAIPLFSWALDAIYPASFLGVLVPFGATAFMTWLVMVWRSDIRRQRVEGRGLDIRSPKQVVVKKTRTEKGPSSRLLWSGFDRTSKSVHWSL